MPKLDQHGLSTVYSRKQWEKAGTRKRSGVVLPLFSVYSSKSVGIGEFDDLRLAVDWCAATGNSILQLLPLNEFGPTFCPYDSVSSFALEPAYLSLRLLPGSRKKAIQDKLADLNKRYPTGMGYVDYRIKKEKLRLLEDIYLEEDLNNAKEFDRFREENSYWVNDFALYMVLKEYHEQRAWQDWHPQFINRDQSELSFFSEKYERDIIFQIWVQWQLYKQLKEVKQYAASRKVLLKGDLPILVSRDSADVWSHADFFKLEFAAGAPPDMYCAKGQRWGMPTYNWEKVAGDDYHYLKEKLKYAQNFYDILRVDHVVGLFRIWSIPCGDPVEDQGLNGFFDPPQEDKWGAQGKKILSVMLDTTGMLLCAEDLGTIPKVCTDTLKELGIPGNDVQRWIKDWDIRHDFLSPEEYRFLSVAMLSTHDTTNWAAWWENEAGTVDEGLFARRCAERGINYEQVKARLFDSGLSRHKRLRWLESITSVEMLVGILGKKNEEVGDFIGMYLDGYREKDKLWAQLKLSGPTREKFDVEMLKSMLKLILESKSVFCIHLITDWLYLGNMFKGDTYQYRINTPGIISPSNWSLTMPISLETLLNHRITPEIKELVAVSGRG